MVCPNCGARNPEESANCAACGRGLREADDSRTIYIEEAGAPETAAKAAPAAAMTWGSLPSMAVAMPAALPAGTTFGRYRIESLLGEGGMGAVYRALDTELGRTVALKLVRPELAANPQTMQRFKQELLLASRISHKNILRIHDLGDANGVKFITMAFVEGTDLARLLERERLPFERALRLARQLCAALEAAHAEGVVHRDLKPQNILIDAADNLYVSDFGLAKSLEAEISMGTRTGQILGTPRYMSPEQVEAKDVDHRADLYAFGLIAYEMFTGELPFRGDSAMQLMYQRVSEAPRNPRTAAPELPEWVANLVLRCLAKDPDARYQSASEILRDIDAMQAAAPRPPGNQTISIQIPRPGRRSWMAIVSTLAALTAIVSFVPKARDSVGAIVFGKKAEGIQQRIAVLPLNVGGGDDLAYLADGVRDSLMAKLSGLRGVYLADDTQVAAAVKKEKDPRKLAQALGVSLLVRGALEASADRISIALRVDDTASGKTVFQKAFPGVRQDLLTIQDQIFGALSASLVIRQSEEERARNALRPTQAYTAYDLYLRGASLLRGKRTAATAQQALDFFDKAIRIDPLFALAYAGTADASTVMWRASNKDEQWIERATSAAEQAARLNDNLPQAHYALGTVYANAGKTTEAIAELRRALDLAPNSDEGYRRLGIAYRKAGQLENAARAFETAINLNRYYTNNYNQAGAVYFSLGENEKARAAYQRVVDLNPQDGDGRGNLATALYRLGRYEEAVAELQRAIQLNPAYNNNLGVVYYFLGRYADAEKAFEAAVQTSPDDPTYLQSLADSQFWSGRREKAAATYGRAIDAALKTLKADPKSKEAMAVLAGCYAHQGNPARALQFIRQARQIDEKDNDLMYREAVIHARAERWPEALASLREALRSGYSLNEGKADPELRALREKPEFAALLDEVAKRSAR